MHENVEQNYCPLGSFVDLCRLLDRSSRLWLWWCSSVVSRSAIQVRFGLSMQCGKVWRRRSWSTLGLYYVFLFFVWEGRCLVRGSIRMVLSLKPKCQIESRLPVNTKFDHIYMKRNRNLWLNLVNVYTILNEKDEDFLIMVVKIWRPWLFYRDLMTV